MAPGARPTSKLCQLQVKRKFIIFKTVSRPLRFLRGEYLSHLALPRPQRRHQGGVGNDGVGSWRSQLGLVQ